jgi:predicted nucleotidyltransferase
MDKKKDHSRTIDYLKKREQEKQGALDELFRKAWRDFEKIVEYIIAEHKPLRIWQWGSLLERKYFSENSDLDIAVEGLKSAKEIFQILAWAEDITEFTVDVVELEKVEPEYRDLIKRKGKLIYGSS